MAESRKKKSAKSSERNSRSRVVGGSSGFEKVALILRSVDPASRNSLLILVCCFLLPFLCGLFAFKQTVRAFYTPSTYHHGIFDSDLDDKLAKLKAEATEVNGGIAETPYGAAVLPGPGFQIRFSGEKDREAIPYVRTHMYTGGIANNRIIFRDGKNEEVVSVPQSTDSQFIVPKNLKPESTSFTVIIASSLPAGVNRPVLVLDKIEVGWRVFGFEQVEADAWAVFPASLAPLLAFYLLGFSSEKKRLIVSGVTSAAVAGMGLITPIMFVIFALLTVLVSIAVVLGQDYFSRKIDVLTPTRLGIVLFAAALVSAALYVRWQWLYAVRNQPAFPDAQVYLRLARSMKWPYDTELREPFLMWVIWLVSELTSWSVLAGRLATLFTGLAGAVALFLLTREFLPTRYAVVSVLAFAFNPALASNSVLAMREECLPLAWMVFLIGCIRAGKEPGNWRYHVLTGVGAGCAVLTRFNALSFILPAYGLLALCYRWRIGKVALALATIMLLVVPHMIGQQIRYGDPLKSMSLYSKIKSEPAVTGSEPAAEAPKKVGLLRGLTANQPISQVVGIASRGTWNMLGGESARNSLVRFTSSTKMEHDLPASLSYFGPILGKPANLFERGLFGLYLIGCVGIFWFRRGWVIPLTMFCFIFPIGYMLGVGNLKEPRMLMNHVPLMAFLMAIGLFTVVRLVGLLKSRDSDQTSV